jgi:protein-tyrosine phosphatase
VNEHPQRMTQARDRLPLITSETDAIRVDFLPPEVIPWGRLGMTIAPGKQNLGFTALWQRDLQTDLRHLRNTYGVDRLVTLLEGHEMEKLNIPTLLTDVETYDMQSCWFPIRDFSTPTSMEGLHHLVQEILTALRQNETVVVHCKGGLGRSGLVAAACLTALGYSPSEAFTQVRRVRPGSVETPAQEAYVVDFAQRLRNGGLGA